jgi:hypothetical protein
LQQEGGGAATPNIASPPPRAIYPRFIEFDSFPRAYLLAFIATKLQNRLYTIAKCSFFRSIHRYWNENERREQINSECLLNYHTDREEKKTARPLPSGCCSKDQLQEEVFPRSPDSLTVAGYKAPRAKVTLCVQLSSHAPPFRQ